MDYSRFKQQIHSILGIDLNSYKEQQMQRRINQWISRHRLNDFSSLVQELKSDQDHKVKFAEYLTINTSQFFRDQMVFQALGKEVLPAITAGGRRPRIWSAGCSIGAEVYSIAMIMQEQEKRFRQLLATDIDDAVIAKAKAGTYLSNQLQSLPQSLLGKYFVKQGEVYQLDETIRKLVTFRRHNLLTDRYDKDFDLILCRNVFIYFTNDTQRKLTQKFVESLLPKGYFVVGSAEQIMSPGALGLKRVSYCIYQKER